jgi:osmotically-inducible protein OsmY
MVHHFSAGTAVAQQEEGAPTNKPTNFSQRWRHEMEQNHLAAQIQQQLDGDAEIHAIVAEQRGRILLSGAVDSELARERAGQIASSMAPHRQIENALTVEHRLSAFDEANNLSPDDFVQGEIPLSILDRQTEKEGIQLDPSLTAQPLETNEIDAMDSGSFDELESVEPDTTYFAPTDPVIGIGKHQTLEVEGGFEATSDDSIEVDRSAENNLPGDEALAEAILRELREDAATTDLNIQVEVDQGVAYLQGTVSDLEDAENAEDVAGRVPGVIDVVDELDIEEM